MTYLTTTGTVTENLDILSHINKDKQFQKTKEL